MRAARHRPRRRPRRALVRLLKGNGAPAVAINPPEMWTGVMALEEVKALTARSIPTRS